MALSLPVNGKLRFWPDPTPR